MSETTNENDHKPAPAAPPKPEAYPEHDKIGPLATGAAWGDADRRSAVITAVRQALADARAAEQRLTSSPSDAVHGVRKALRRARALVELVADALPGRERDDLVVSIRTARRMLSAARDLDVAPATLASLTLSEPDRLAADAFLSALRDAAPSPADRAASVHDAVTRLAAVVDALDAALPPALDDSTFGRGLAATYRRARRARRAGKRSRKQVHAWRRRTKELTHQLALVTAGAGELSRAITEPLSDLSKDLGAVVDLVLMRELVRAHVDAVPGFDGAGLLAAVDQRYDELAGAGRKRGKDLFDRGGRKFARRVQRALRKDREPPSAADADMPATD